MLITFESITQPLTEQEMESIPTIIKCLETNHRGKDKAISNKRMREGLKTVGIHLNETGIRKIITYIRVNGLIQCGSGYFVPNTRQEIRDCIQSQQERISSQQETLNALCEQYNRYVMEGN